MRGKSILSAAALAAALGAPPVQPAGKPHTVTIEGMKFAPERIEVAVGDTITWINKDFLPHSVTAPAARLESGDLASNQSWKFSARKKGEIDYICRLHPVMRGVIVAK
ncbi:MAG TPA: cupredoxin family copper-binding protein [Myxococcaceae bacterium]|nr:cupredoxin family copper-binding protein [Myxococcaceae bacterium]